MKSLLPAVRPAFEAAEKTPVKASKDRPGGLSHIVESRLCEHVGQASRPVQSFSQPELAGKARFRPSVARALSFGAPYPDRPSSICSRMRRPMGGPFGSPIVGGGRRVFFFSGAS